MSSKSLMETMMKLCLEMEQNKKNAAENSLLKYHKSRLKSRLNLEEKLKTIPIIIGVYTIDQNSKKICQDTWVKTIQKYQKLGFPLHLIWIEKSKYQVYFDQKHGQNQSILHLPFKNGEDCRDKFINYCRLYFKPKWKYIILTSSTCYLNIKWLLYDSNFYYYDRYGYHLWNSSLLDFYFNSKHNKKYDESNDLAKLGEDDSKFKTKEILLGTWQNPYPFIKFLSNNANTNNSKKVIYLDVPKLQKGIGYDYFRINKDNIARFIYLHHRVSELVDSLQILSEAEYKKFNINDVSFYNLHLTTEEKIYFNIDSNQHLYWGCLASLSNRFTNHQYLFKDQTLLNNQSLLKILPADSEIHLYHPIYSGDQIVIANLSTEEGIKGVDVENSEYFIYKINDKLTNIIEDRCCLCLNDLVVLINSDKSGYLKYKNGQYKYQQLIENLIDGTFSEKGIWQISQIVQSKFVP